MIRHPRKKLIEGAPRSREGGAAGTYVRVGSTNRRADAALIAEMRRYILSEGFDEQPLPDLDSEAVDFRAASESFARVRTCPSYYRGRTRRRDGKPEC